MPTFKITYENNLYSALTPLEAAKAVREDIINGEALMFTVENEQTGEVFSVDLDADDEDAVVKLNENYANKLKTL